jgi:hypothetical protein
MPAWSGWRAVMLCLVTMGAVAVGRVHTAQSKPTSAALVGVIVTFPERPRAGLCLCVVR